MSALKGRRLLNSFEWKGLYLCLPQQLDLLLSSNTLFFSIEPCGLWQLYTSKYNETLLIRSRQTWEESFADVSVRILLLDTSRHMCE